MASAPEIEKPVGLKTSTEDVEGLVDSSPETAEVSPELEQYVEKVEMQPGPGPIADDSGQTLLTPSTQTATITLPLTDEEVQEGLRHPVVDAIFWLAKWCKLLVKKAALIGGRVVYRK